MSELQYQVYDFASSAKIERPLWVSFNHWMEKFAELMVEHWSNFSLTPITASQQTIDAQDFETLQNSWLKPMFAAEVRFNDDSVTGMVLIERTDLLKMLMSILGDTDEVEDRELTTVELSLAELLFQQSTASLIEAWPGQRPLSFKLDEIFQQPNRSRLFAADKLLLTSGLNVQLADTSVGITILLAKDEACDLMGIRKRTTEPSSSNQKIDHEKIAEIDVQVIAGLGTAELAMDELASISVGDVIVLDQSVEQPLVISANDEPVFFAWPGRVDSTQALKIVSPFS